MVLQGATSTAHKADMNTARKNQAFMPYLRSIHTQCFVISRAAEKGTNETTVGMSNTNWLCAYVRPGGPIELTFCHYTH